MKRWNGTLNDARCASASPGRTTLHVSQHNISFNTMHNLSEWVFWRCWKSMLWKWQYCSMDEMDWMYAMHMYMWLYSTHSLSPSLSPYITDFCAIFLSTYMSSARHAMKATNKSGSYNMYCTQVFIHLNMLYSLWTRELSSCQYAMHITHFASAQNQESASKLKMGRRREDSWWDKKKDSDKWRRNWHARIHF